MKSTLKLESPWYTFRKKLNALFEGDPDIKIGEIDETEDGKLYLDIEVKNHEKFMALDRLMPKVKTFGNVSLIIYIYDEENTNEVEDPLELYKAVFEGNPNVQDVQEAMDARGFTHGFIRFKPKVLQFYHDDISDYNGNWSGLAQDIAREVFEAAGANIHFCTAPVKD